MHPNYYEVKEIASYTYEAVTTSAGMVLNNVGKGSKYLASYLDENKEVLDGRLKEQVSDALENEKTTIRPGG